MVSLTRLFLSSALAVAVQAHMQLYYPPPFAAENNPHRTDPADPYLDYPYNCCGRKTVFPCKGYLNLLGTPQGAPVATWEAGSVQNFSLTGTGNHYGGSCQVGFSTDQGKTWKVARSYEGDCPHRHGGTDPAQQTFDFTVPDDIPAGNQVFAWTWINREQEFSMLCSSVTITKREDANATFIPGVPWGKAVNGTGLKNLTVRGIMHGYGQLPSRPGLLPMNNQSDPKPSTAPSIINARAQLPVRPGPPSQSQARSWMPPHGRRRPGARPNESKKSLSSNNSTNTTTLPNRTSRRAVAFNDRPSFLFANLDNGCMTPKTDYELKYPNPGPDVEGGDGEYKLRLPMGAGNCTMG
ncbi:hypothetical protein FQN50_000261 [Emmonsiellopsis sp. PD_5]|nr:hypothetical protein FQN50_000261 [Emmonsiellopsis sp. PD_5]